MFLQSGAIRSKYSAAPATARSARINDAEMAAELASLRVTNL